MVPAKVSAFLAEHEISLLGDSDVECEGAKFHSPTPLFCVQTRLAPWMEFDSPTAMLCGTCRDNLSVLHEMLYSTDGVIDWPVRREFGNGIRALAERGWKAYSDRVHTSGTG